MTISRFFATNRRPPPLIDEVSAGRPRISRLVWVLTILTGLFIMWVLWRYGVAADTFSRAPVWMGDLLGLLTAAGLLTLVVLWGVVIWQKRGVGYGPDNPAITLEQLYALSPRAFEHHVAELFERRGYHVEVRGRTGDLGVDLMLTKDNGRTAIVQCKRYRHAIGPDIVRELFGTMVHERASHGFLVTTATISEGARAWAADKPITLIDGHTLAKLSAVSPH